MSCEAQSVVHLALAGASHGAFAILISNAFAATCPTPASTVNSSNEPSHDSVNTDDNVSTVTVSPTATTGSCLVTTVKSTATRRGRKRIRCYMTNCSEVNCTHCACKGECGRGHEPGHCGNGRYGTRANCNQCKVAFYCLKKKKKRAQDAALAEAALVASGVSVPPPPTKKAKTKRKSKAKTTKKSSTMKSVMEMGDILAETVDENFMMDRDGMGAPLSFLGSDNDSATDFEDIWDKDEVFSDTASSASGSSCPTSPSNMEDTDDMASFFEEKVSDDQSDSELLLFDFSEGVLEEPDISGWDRGEYWN